MEKEMERFEKAFEAAMASDVAPMDEMVRYAATVRGKRLRPRLVFLSARLFGVVNDATRRTALFVELFHTATLIHDDVVDGSDLRRGQPSVNARWGGRSAVLAGDYLLAKALAQLSESSDQAVLREMLAVAMAMSEGELLQAAVFDNRHCEGGTTEATRRLTDRREVTHYLNVIEHKTARLIRACCIGGALSVHAPSDVINKVGDFGLHLGLVFQMRDDLLDNENTVWAQQLLPEYLDRTLKALDALTPYIKDKDAQNALRELTLFCAERIH